MPRLTPYPEPNAKQDKIVHRVELFANGLKKILNTIKLPVKPFYKLRKKISQRHWRQRLINIPEHELQPPQETGVHVANSTRAMDFNFFYMLKNGRIWYKPIAAAKNAPWKLFGPDGIPPTGKKLLLITSDGRNLVAIDELGIVNYVHTNKINYYVTDNSWEIHDIDLDWTDRWFAIPIVNKVVGLIKSKYLMLPKDCIAIAISQKGPETGYYTDMNGKKQPEFLVGVTTLYALTKTGRIFFADPWLGNGFWNEITAPEDGQFVAENMAVAASTIFLIRRDETGKPCMYTRFADFDSIGSNPLLPATHDADNQIPLVRRLPGEDWVKQPDIPLEKLARVTSEISVIQTGRGQHNRQLRVEGTNANGEPGYYYKKIYEDTWHFEITPEQVLVFNKPSTTREHAPPPVDLPGIFYSKDAPSFCKNVELKKFLHHGLSERGLHTVLEFTLSNGRVMKLPLLARRSWIHLLGKRNDKPYWDLVMPKDLQYDPDPEVKAILNTIFKNKIKRSVSVYEHANGNIQIINKHMRFKFEFEAISKKNVASNRKFIKPSNLVVTFVQSKSELPLKSTQNKIKNYGSQAMKPAFFEMKHAKAIQATQPDYHRRTLSI